MSWFRAPVRLVEEAAETDPALATALRDWSLETTDAHAIVRLERQLTAALSTQRVGASERPAPAWLLGLWALSATILLTFSLRALTPHELDAPGRPSQRDAIASGPSMLEMASRLGVGPRELASQEAMDALQPCLRR